MENGFLAPRDYVDVDELVKRLSRQVDGRSILENALAGGTDAETGTDVGTGGSPVAKAPVAVTCSSKCAYWSLLLEIEAVLTTPVPVVSPDSCPLVTTVVYVPLDVHWTTFDILGYPGRGPDT